MADYDALAEVYDWLVPDALLTPRGSAAAFADHVPDGARVLDCAAGTGTLAVGLALRGCEVVASDASAAMIARVRRLAAAHAVDVAATVCTWQQLAERGWAGRFDVVLCVGNSLSHARGRAARQAALRAMAGVLAPGGRLVLTSRTWELVRARGSHLHVGERLVARDGRRGLPIYSWTIPASWDEVHTFDVAVALVGDDGGVRTIGERVDFWPFELATLVADLRSAGLELEHSSDVADKAGRYLVTARTACAQDRHEPATAAR